MLLRTRGRTLCFISHSKGSFGNSGGRQHLPLSLDSLNLELGQRDTQDSKEFLFSDCKLKCRIAILESDGVPFHSCVELVWNFKEGPYEERKVMDMFDDSYDSK